MSHHKKQKIDDEFALQSQEAHELKAIKSAIKELLDHSRSQMTSIQDEMKGMKAEMKGMREEIKSLGCKCGAMKKSLQKSHYDSGLLEQNANNFCDRVDSRFDELKNNLKCHEVMLKNQKWEYSAPPPSPDEASDRKTRNFLQEIKKRTCDMRYGRSNGKILIPAVHYNHRFLPHWTEFSNALQEYQHMIKCLPKDVCTTFWICAEMPQEVLDLLSSALESTHFKCFSLMMNNLGRDGVKFSLNYLQNNPVLNEFNLFYNSIDHNDQVNKLCDIIKEHPSIERMQLNGCFGGDMAVHDTLCSIMTAGTNKLKRIGFGSNSMSTGGSTFISDFLATNPPLESLSLENNQLDDKDAVSIASALKYNRNLQYLALSDNSITSSGWEALRVAEFDDRSLTSAVDSNHTCVFSNPEYSAINFDLDTYDLFRRSAVRSKKIYSVLSARNRECSNVQYWDPSGDTPIQFLPDALGAIQRYSEYHHGENAPIRADDDVEALSLVFELLRRWDKALSVYESLK